MYLNLTDQNGKQFVVAANHIVTISGDGDHAVIRTVDGVVTPVREPEEVVLEQWLDNVAGNTAVAVNNLEMALQFKLTDITQAILVVADEVEKLSEPSTDRAAPHRRTFVAAGEFKPIPGKTYEVSAIGAGGGSVRTLTADDLEAAFREGWATSYANVCVPPANWGGAGCNEARLAWGASEAKKLADSAVKA